MDEKEFEEKVRLFRRQREEFDKNFRTQLKLFVSLLSTVYPDECKLPLAAFRAIDECPTDKLPGPKFNYLEPDQSQTLDNFLELIAKTREHYNADQEQFCYNPHILDDPSAARFFMCMFQE